MLAASSSSPVAAAGAPPERVAAYDLPFLLDTVAGGPTTDQAGRARVAADFAGDLVVVGLMTARCPSLCVLRALDLSAVAKALPDAVRSRLRVVAISIDPADRPADLAAFADGLHLDPALFTLLATDAGQAARIGHAIGQRIRRAGEDAAEPSTNLFLFDRRGQLMQSFGGRALDRARLAREIVALDAYDASVASQTSRP